MKKLKNLYFSLFLLLTAMNAGAEEGMWLLSMLDGYTIEDMQSKGFKLTADDIYSVNEACLKDAVVIFGGGCTGEMISGDGLVLTNHHCGYGAIQSLSSVEKDYLTNGFWAMGKDEELPSKGLSVRFLRYMKDVGNLVMEGVTDEMDDAEQDNLIQMNMASIISDAEEEGKYEAVVSSMFYGNQFFLFVYERYNDVRLVGAPPSSIGNFGRDTDNWMWPRHTGDFSIFRVYASSDNQPADYNPDNVPYKPKKFLEISTSGIEKGDFTMILGYPGSTKQFLYSDAIDILMDISLPLKIDIRTQRMQVMDNYMEKSDRVRIQYSSKYRGVSNAWKKWQGAIKGLERLDAVEKKLAYEKQFKDWMNADESRKEKYGNVLSGFENIYSELEAYQVIYDLISEAIFAVESFQILSQIEVLMKDTVPADDIKKRAESMLKDYYMPLDREMLAVMLNNYLFYAPSEFHPELFETIQTKYNGDFKAYAEKTFLKSFMGSQDDLFKLIDIYGKNQARALRKLKKDPVLAAFNQFYDIYAQKIRPDMGLFFNHLDDLYKLWVQGVFEFEPEVRHYPDANFTMRLTYGNIEGYIPKDAVKYEYHTTLSGVIEKEKEGMHDYIIPEKLRELYEMKNFGDYGVNGTMPVCFTASNHTSGGNSGSPVMDANGRLIGINFDRNWHGTMSDEMYDPQMCRNISVDIRYILFIIDKFAGAGYLLDEMVLVDE